MLLPVHVRTTEADILHWNSQGLEVSDRQKNGSTSFKKRFSTKSLEANGLIFFVICEAYWHRFKKCLLVKRKLETVTVIGSSGS